MSSQKAKQYMGYVSIKTHYFDNVKEDMKKKRQRFQKTNFSSRKAYNNGEKEELNFLLIKDQEKLENNGTASLLSRKTTAESMSMELGKINQASLPSEWGEYYEQTVEYLNDIAKLQAEIQKLSADRVKIQFGSNKDLDQQIQSKTNDALDKLRKCEQNITNIDRRASMLNETENDQKIRANVKKSMAIQIQEQTMSLRAQQKKLFETLTKYDNVSQNQNLPEQIKSPWQTEEEQQNNDCDLMIEYSQQRDGEINKLVDSMNQLSSIFKQLNNLVIDQGTLLDRIDFNMDTTQKHITQSVKHLTKAKEHQESPCAKRTINILITLIVILSIILIIKYSS